MKYLTTSALGPYIASYNNLSSLSLAVSGLLELSEL